MHPLDGGREVAVTVSHWDARSSAGGAERGAAGEGGGGLYAVVVEVKEAVEGSHGSEGSEGSGEWVNVAPDRPNGSDGGYGLGSGVDSAELGVRPTSASAPGEGENDVRRHIRRQDRAS